MSADPKKYKPPSISQRDTLLAADGVDDCRAVSAVYLAGCGTLGEIFTWPNGNTMGRRNRVALVKRARRSLGPDNASGGLNTTDTTNMLKYFVPDAPTLYPVDITFGELREKLRSGFSSSLSGNPGSIKGDSPLKRAGNVPHEFFLWGEKDDRILVGDPFKPYAPRFGEWVPWQQVRQFAFKDSDRTLTACFALERGAWTSEQLLRVKKNKQIAVVGRSLEKAETQRDAALAALKDCEDECLPCDEQLAAQRDEILDRFVSLIEDIRQE